MCIIEDDVRTNLTAKIDPIKNISNVSIDCSGPLCHPLEVLNQKANTLLGVLIGIGIALLLGGAYYFGMQRNQSISNFPFINKPLPFAKTLNQISSPANNNPVDPTVDWQVYKTSRYTFKYPKDWEITAPSDAYGFAAEINVHDPRFYTLGGAHQRVDNKNYTTYVNFQRVDIAEPGTTNRKIYGKTPRESFDRGNTHYEIIAGGFVISRDNITLTGSSSLQDTTKDSTEYNIISSITSFP